MRAIDTNIVVRLIVADNAAQTLIAEQLVSEPFLIVPTVLLETVWVLEKSYRLDRAELNGRLSDFLGNANATVVSADAVDWALERHLQGADFADALHMALAAEAQASKFSTFDKVMNKHIADPPIPIETLT